MIVQNGSRVTQDARGAGRVSDELQRAAIASPSGESRRGRAVESPQADALPIASQQVSAEQLKKAVESINSAMRQSNRTLQFSMDEEANRLIVKLTDSETGELIRQIPSDETLAISRALGDFQQGLLLRQKA